MNYTHFKLNSLSIPVKGKETSIIVNLYNAGYTVIPSFLYEIFTEYPGVSIVELEGLYKDTSNSLIRYFNYLEAKQIGFFTNEPEAFPAIELNWFAPQKIINGVLQIESLERIDYSDLLKQLDALMCVHVDLWFTQVCREDSIAELLNGFDQCGIRSFDIYMPYHKRLSEGTLHKLTGVKKVSETIIYKAPFKRKNSAEQIFYTPRHLDNPRLTFRNISKNKFIIYLPFFTESITYNPYYNKKICIDKDGFIRNCLTHDKEFGNVSSCRLLTMTNRSDFTELWYACNDKILEIQDSPFRYIWLNTANLEKIDADTFKMLP